ncbi:MAG: N-acyl homoserine lactonase family protein [Candidatus Nanopelagicales bacterium]
MHGLGTAKRLWALDSPTFTIDRADLMVGASGEVTIPMPAYLIEHPRGLVLFDTGLVPESIDDPHSVYGELADLTRLAVKPEQRLDKQLRALGYDTSDVTHVVLSHSHFDHAGGLYLFPEATFYVGAGEFGFAFWPIAVQSPYFRLDDIERVRHARWRIIHEPQVDIFGDGSLIVLLTPGHTPGELSMLVRLANRNFILTGDTVHLRDALEKEVPDPIDWNTDLAVQSLQKLKIVRDAADATVWITHDPDDWAELQHAPHCYE